MKMKRYKLLLIVLLIVMGCDKSSSTAPQVEDSAGVAGGTSVLDDAVYVLDSNDECGVCNGDGTIANEARL